MGMTANHDIDKNLNRLRAAAGLIPIIESGLAKAQMPADRAVSMCRFCEWSLATDGENDGEALKLRNEVVQGLSRINAVIALRGKTE